MEPVLVYITASSREEAILLSNELLGERLIACANIVDNVTSLYWWQGEIKRETEVILVAKTLAGHVESITAHVKKLHSYDNPCVISVPIQGGNPEYLSWIAKEASGSASRETS